MEQLALIGQVLFGGFFVLSGLKHFTQRGGMIAYAKSRRVPMASLAVAVSGLLIIVGGLGILLGMYTRLSVLLVALFLIPVSFTMHNFWKDTDPNMRAGNMVNFTKNMALLGAALMLL